MNKNHQEAIERLRRDFACKPHHGLPYGYEDWDNYDAALEAFLLAELTLAEERGRAYLGKTKREWYQKGHEDGVKAVFSGKAVCPRHFVSLRCTSCLDELKAQEEGEE